MHPLIPVHLKKKKISYLSLTHTATFLAYNLKWEKISQF